MLGQEAQNYMFTRKVNYIWIINLVLLIAVVFLGIEQATRGAKISELESRLVSVSNQKRELSEDIFTNNGNDLGLLSNASESGFIKPLVILYFNSIDTVASK